MTSESKTTVLTPSEWRPLLEALGDQLSDQERSIARLLAEEKTQAAIADQLGLHRSLVWRRAKAMTARYQRSLSRTEAP